MRLLQLVTAPGELIDLHPNVTIVQGLDERSRELLVSAVVGLARGRADGTGLLEVHGVLFALDDRHLGVLDLQDLDVDPVVRSQDLPGAPGALDARHLHEQRQAFENLLPRVAQHAEAQSRARDAVNAAAGALERARAAHAEAQAATATEGEPDRTSVDAIEDRLLTEWSALEAARSARQALERQVGQLEEAVQVAAARTAGLVSRLDELGEVADEQPAIGEASPSGDLSASQAAAEARLVELDKRLAALELPAVDGIEEAVRLARVGAEVVPSPEAGEVADEILRLDARLGDVDAAAASADAVASARSRVDDARQALLEAEAGARAPVLDRTDVDQLEQAHEAVQDALERAGGAFSGGRAQRRVEERRAEEQAILDRFGFLSYADYVMGSSARGRDPQRETTLRMAREELREAEDDWRDLHLVVEEVLQRAELLDRRRELSDRARAFLGRTVARDEESAALRALRVPAVAPDLAAQSLRSALDHLGVDLGDEELDLDDLSLVAEAFLGATADGERRRSDLVEERAVVEAQLKGLGSMVEPGSAAVLAAEQATERPPFPGAVVAHPRAALDEELASAGALEAASVEAAQRARTELEQALADERVVAERVAASEAELEAASTSDLLAELAAVDLAPADPEKAAAVDVLAASVEAAEAEHRDALARIEAEDRSLAALDHDGRALAAQIERLEELVAAQEAGTSTSTDDLEWYLLARLAGQRAVSVVGSLPLLFDDALAGLDSAQARQLLDRLEPMAEAVQLIILSEDPNLAAWVDGVGAARAAIVRPTAA